MDIQVIFNEKRLSPEKQAAIDIAKKNEHVNEKGVFKVKFQKICPDLYRLLGLCRYWKTSSVLINNQEEDFSPVLETSYCSLTTDCSSNCDKGSFDYIPLIKSLSDIIEGNNVTEPIMDWLKEDILCVDSFERQKDGYFIIDKEKLKKEIERTYSIPMNICPKFDKEKIMNQIDSLPKKFKLPEESLDKKSDSDFFDADTLEELEAKAEIVAPIFAEAIAKEFDKVIIANFGSEKNATALAKKGDALFSLQRYEESLDCYNKALEMDATNPKIWFEKGQLLEIGFENYVDAAKAYDKVLEFDSNMAYALYCKGICFDSLGMVDEAISVYEKAIELYSKNLEKNPNDEELKEELNDVKDNLSALKE